MSRYKISEQHKKEYFGRGYTTLKGAVAPELLSRLQKMSKSFEKSILTEQNKSNQLKDVLLLKDSIGHKLMRYNNIYKADVDTTLDLLASPPIISIFRDICGRNAVPMKMDILYKYQHPHSQISWHQDELHNRAHPYVCVGLFLDDAEEDDGCLQYIPNTQYEKQNIEILSSQYGRENPKIVQTPVKAGDINIHDMMILHSSTAKISPGVRRTIYIQIRPYEGIIESNPQDKELAELQRRFMGLVLRRANLDDWPTEWEKDYPDDLGSDEEEIKRIIKKSLY